MNHNPLYEEDLSYINNYELPWNKLEGKTILVTGGSGLIGSAFIDAMIYRNETKASGINIWVLARNEQTILERFGEYLKRDYFHYLCQDVSKQIRIDSPIDYILHGAGKGDPYSFAADPVGIMNANYLGMYHVMELAREKGTCKVVYISSGEIYGNQPPEYRPEEGVRETDYAYVDILNPRSCYASAKRAAETLCAAHIRQFGADLSIARPCHIYGSTMLASDNRVVGEFLRKANKKEPIVLKSQGLQERSYCYVADAITALFLILLRGETGKAYNIADRYSVITIRDMAKLLADRNGTEVIFEQATDTEKKGYSDITRAVLDPSNLENLGWKARYHITEGLHRVLDMME